MNNVSLLLAACAALACASLHAADRDPTRPIAYKAPANPTAASGLKLQSLLISQQRRQATINGKSVQLGDRIGGAKVIAIEPKGVTVERSGERRLLTLHTHTVKTTTAAGTKARSGQ